MKVMHKLLSDQEGACLTRLVFLAAIVAVIVLFVLDGFAVLKAYNRAGDVSTAAAQAAESGWKQERNDAQAREAAAGYCQEHGLELADFQVLDKPFHGYLVSCPADARTRIFQHLPWFRSLIHQANAGTAYDS